MKSALLQTVDVTLPVVGAKTLPHERKHTIVLTITRAPAQNHHLMSLQIRTSCIPNDHSVAHKEAQQKSSISSVSH